MFPLRCLHPPSGAVALTAVLGGTEVARLGYGFVWPVLVNSSLLLLAALVFNNLSRRRYPHRSIDAVNPHRTADPLPSQRLGLTGDDLTAALEARGELLDITKDDLKEVLADAQLRAERRYFGAILCGDIMARDVVQVRPDTRVADAWRLLVWHQIKALPVSEADHKLVGIVSLHDFFVARGTLQPLPSPVLDRLTEVSEIMTVAVRTARPEQSVAELVPLFSDGGLHHLPVVDGEGRVVGIITQSDMVAALFKTAFDHATQVEAAATTATANAV